MIRRTKRSLSFDLSKNLYIDEGDLRELEFIGQGSFGQVWKCSLSGHPSPVALKRVNIPIEEEGMILRLSTHPNIIQYLGVVHSPPKYGLVMEFAENGSLSDYIHRPDNEVDRPIKDSFIRQISAGMLYLHHGANIPIIHRDLKPQNILLCNNFSVAKIADFGCAKLMQDSTVLGSNRGSSAYMAPELIREEGKLSRSVDVYSFGVVLWEILTQKRPFEGKNEAQIIYFKGNGNCLSVEDENIGFPYKEIIEKCFENDRKMRPNFKTIQSTIVNNMTPSNSSDTSIFSFGSDPLPDISASGDNSRLAWICNPKEIAPEAEWSPGNKHSFAVRKNASTVMVVNAQFFTFSAPTDGQGQGVDLGPELIHRDRVVTCCSWDNGMGAMLATGTKDGRVWLWTAQGDLLRRVIVRNGQPIIRVDWNGDSSAVGVVARSESNPKGVDVFFVSLETEFEVTCILSFNSFSNILAWSKFKHDMLVCCESNKIHIFKSDYFSLSAPKTSNPAEFKSAVWSPVCNYVALVTQSGLQIFSVESSVDRRMKVRCKTAMSKLGDIQAVAWHPKNGDELFLNNHAEFLVINIAKKNHRKIFTAEKDFTLSHFSLNPSGQIAAVFEEEKSCLYLIQTSSIASPDSPQTDPKSRNCGKVLLMKKDVLIDNPKWNSDGSQIILPVDFARNDMNLFEHAVLLVNLESRYALNCLVLERPKNVKTVIEISK